MGTGEPPDVGCVAPSRSAVERVGGKGTRAAEHRPVGPHLFCICQPGRIWTSDTHSSRMLELAEIPFGRGARGDARNTRCARVLLTRAGGVRGGRATAEGRGRKPTTFARK